MPKLSELQATRDKLLAQIKADQQARRADLERISKIDKPEAQSERKQKLVDDRTRLGDQVSALQKRLDGIEEQIAKEQRVTTVEALNTRSCIDGKTTWLCLKLVLTDCRQSGGWTGVVNAADRTPEHCDDCGPAFSQQKLWDCSHACVASCLGNCNPANPPGQGSHEGVNGGSAAFPELPYGSQLEHWRWGLDLSMVDSFIAACSKLGYHVKRPYSNESWHFNLTVDPRPRLRERGLIG